ncbi:MAG TPA: hypothetical protein VLM89_10055 [Phycisphaerae bacterium]|nr:hypothetical protein [Phycisphaerae bacterium]
MTATEMRWRWLALVLGTLVLVGGLAGCGKDDDQPEFVERNGRVAEINRETGVVKMWYYHPREKKELVIPGRLDPNVEVFINGAAATPDDVMIDDEVKVLGRIEGSGPNKQLVAVKVEVTRPVIESAPAASAPASQ